MILNETANNATDNKCEEAQVTFNSSDASLQPNAVESKKYWESVDSTVDGMLGGFTRINHIDIQESRKLLSEYFNFYNKLSTPLEQLDPISSGHTCRSNCIISSSSSGSSNNEPAQVCKNGLSPSTVSDNDSKETGENDTGDIGDTATGETLSTGRTRNRSSSSSVKRQRNKYNDVREKSNGDDTCLQESVEEKLTQKRDALHSLDAGAGIGRITKNLLLSFSHSVDLLEQNGAFLNKSLEYIGLEERPRIGKLIVSSLQSFEPPVDYTYDIIWIQWVTGYLSDDELVTFFTKCASSLTPQRGLIFVKDNVTSRIDLIDADMNDSSVTRPKNLLESFFTTANLQILQVRKQVKFPKGLYPVYMWVLDTKKNNCSSGSVSGS